MNPQFRDTFIEGFGSVFRQWTALELAVHNCWGGPQSADKANELMNQVLALFNNPKTIYKDVNDHFFALYLFLFVVYLFLFVSLLFSPHSHLFVRKLRC